MLHTGNIASVNCTRQHARYAFVDWTMLIVLLLSIHSLQISSSRLRSEVEPITRGVSCGSICTIELSRPFLGRLLITPTLLFRRKRAGCAAAACGEMLCAGGKRRLRKGYGCGRKLCKKLQLWQPWRRSASSTKQMPSSVWPGWIRGLQAPYRTAPAQSVVLTQVASHVPMLLLITCSELRFNVNAQ